MAAALSKRLHRCLRRHPGWRGVARTLRGWGRAVLRRVRWWRLTAAERAADTITLSTLGNHRFGNQFFQYRNLCCVTNSTAKLVSSNQQLTELLSENNESRSNSVNHRVKFLELRTSLHLARPFKLIKCAVIVGGIKMHSDWISYLQQHTQHLTKVVDSHILRCS